MSDSGTGDCTGVVEVWWGDGVGTPYSASCGFRGESDERAWCEPCRARRAALGAFDDTEEQKRLRLDGHKCRKIATVQKFMAEGRDWWLGELLEPMPDWPAETHCLHMTTPIKDVVFGVMAGDASLFAVLMQVLHGGPVDPLWLNRMEHWAREAAMLEDA